MAADRRARPEPGPPAAAWTIRPAAPGEARRVAAFGAALFRQAYGSTHPEPTLSIYLAESFDPARGERALREGGTTVLVAETGASEWIGYAELREGAPGATTRLERPLPAGAPIEVARFYVEAAWHGRGVAQALMAACESEARARGAGVVWLQAWQRAPQALAFYRKAGFEVHGTAVFRFGEREDADFLLARGL